MIEAITPSQWKPNTFHAPLSERYGEGHSYIQAAHVEKHARVKAHKKRVSTLGDTTKHDRFNVGTAGSSAPGTAMSRGPTPGTAGSGRLNTAEESMAAAELLGLDSEVLANTFKKKTGGVYGHFFKDLSPGVKTMVMTRFTANKQLIQKEGARMTDMKRKRGDMTTDNQPKTTMSILRAKAAASHHTADYDKGTTSEAEMIEEFLIAAQKMERVAVRMQRIWRMRAVRIVARRYWKEQHAALCIQRLVRARYARLYFSLLKKLVPVAIKRIQECYRYFKKKQMMMQWFALVHKAVGVIAPLLKKLVKALYTKWNVRHHDAATMIQSVLRMHLGKVVYYHRVGTEWLKVTLINAVVVVQANVRRFLSLKRIKIMTEARMVIEIDIPASICMQRIARGKMGRMIYAQKKKENYASIVIQKYMMRFQAMLYYSRLRQIMLEKFCANQVIC
jgi:hypothetical protein